MNRALSNRLSAGLRALTDKTDFASSASALSDFGNGPHLLREERLSELAGRVASEGSAIGTPLFMAPEQARGENPKLDGRTDVYIFSSRCPDGAQGPEGLPFERPVSRCFRLEFRLQSSKTPLQTGISTKFSRNLPNYRGGAPIG